MDRGAWRATAHGDAKNQTQLSTHAHAHRHPALFCFIALLTVGNNMIHLLTYFLFPTTHVNKSSYILSASMSD